MSRRRTKRERAVATQQLRLWRQERRRRKTGRSLPKGMKWADESRSGRPLGVWPASPLRTTESAVIVRIPKVFSLIDNPHESLETLNTLVRVLAAKTVQRVDLDHSGCDQLDLCASVVADVLVAKANRQSKFRNRKLTIGGKFSASPDVNLLLVAIGILKHLRHPISKNIPPQIMGKLRLADLFIGTTTPPQLSSETEIDATRIADFFDSCLGTEQYRLREDWKSALIDLITEVLDNAEEHARTDKYWHTIGYFHQSDDAEEGGLCHIVLFNFGDSIYESLCRPDVSTELQRQIGELANEHKRRQLFVRLSERVGLLMPLWEEESLWTLYALQEGISRFRGSEGGGDRGNGTIRMLEFFAELASKDPRLAILSGRTHILFDGKYRIAPVEVQPGETRKVIAFNEENDLRRRPDPQYVQTLETAFPGTIVSLRFRLRRADLDQIRERLDHAD